MIKSFPMFYWRYILNCTLNVNFIFRGSAGKGDNLLPWKHVHVFKKENLNGLNGSLEI